MPQQRGKGNKRFAYRGKQTELRFSFSFKILICIDVMKKKNEYNRNEYVQFSDNSLNRRCFLEVFFFKYGFVFVNVNNNPNWFWSMHFIYNLSLHSGFFLHRDNILVRYINACCLYWLKSLGIHCLHYALCLFYLKLILRISRYRIIVTHQDKAKVNNKLKNTT